MRYFEVFALRLREGGLTEFLNAAFTISGYGAAMPRFARQSSGHHTALDSRFRFQGHHRYFTGMPGCCPGRLSYH